MRRQRGWFGQTEKWTIAAQTPDEWLAREAQPARRAIIAHRPIDDPRISDRMSAGLVGGGRWQLNVASDGRMNVWEAKWEVGDRTAPDQRIWRVSYALVAENANAAPARLEPLDAVIPTLRQTTSDVLTFCDDHRLDSFAQCFRRAAECLVANDPLALVYHKDLAPEGLLSLSAKQVLAACQAAWVFGGMGSWNDLEFDGQEESRYQRLSKELFALLNMGISASVNSSC
ncbi:MAG TPA: hypothetical protein VK335_25345 [Bryobacteraceae bacterium]|nr:hypothetical protein [Bryobacteraceae bacterium]